MRKSYSVTAYRDGGWWTFEIPELSSPSPRGSGRRIVAMGQSRKAGDVARDALQLAALWDDADPDDLEVTVVFQLPSAVKSAVEEAEELDAEGREALGRAARLRRQAVHELRAEGLTQADSAVVLGLSRQRVQQLDASEG